MKKFLDLKHRDCRWPLGGLMDKPEFFCGAPRDDIKPYCAEHARLAQADTPRRTNLHMLLPSREHGALRSRDVEPGEGFILALTEFDEAFA